MRLEPLPSIILALAERRSLNEVLRIIIEAVSRQPSVALARLWLRQPQVECPACVYAKERPPEDALHLRASAGTSLMGEDWGRINGSFHHIPVERSQLKIVHIAVTGESIRIQRIDEDRQWIRHPEWAKCERLVSFTGHALVFRGEPLGTLAVFRREPADDACFEWLRTMANAAAVAIANARAFEQNEALRSELELERDYLREEVAAVGAFGDILGRSLALDRALNQVRMVAQTNANVLILGESGTGKELIARAIHQGSARAHKPMVKVNCGSVPRELFESEFFGHVRGSFTGAVRDRVGRFQLADGGTLFLDEVGEIPIELQSKLLRVLQEGEFERVGEDSTRRVNARVIAATNRDLRREIEAGNFRLDLFYRLGVFPIELPPLRERKDDIPELIAHFVRLACTRFHIPQPVVPASEAERAKLYEWPGNIRELQNVVERAVIVSNGRKVRFELPQAMAASPRPSGMRTTSSHPTGIAAGPIIPENEWRKMERANIEAALRHSRGRISGKGGAAELLGLNPATLASRIKVLRINPKSVAANGGEEDDTAIDRLPAAKGQDYDHRSRGGDQAHQQKPARKAVP